MSEIMAVNWDQACEDYQRVEAALRFLESQAQAQPSLSEIADHVGLSEYHFQRLFTRWVGISPKRFLQFLTKERAREALENSASLLQAAYEAGLSGPGRLHDLFITWEAATPGEIKQRGAGLEIVYGFHPTPFGECLLAQTERGICNLFFVQNGDRQAVLDDLQRRWSGASLRQDAKATSKAAYQAFTFFNGERAGNMQLFLSGTRFQLKVWEALLQVPAGTVVSYEDIAARIGRPTASRAVSGAIGSNPVSVIIPCHRVIRKMGEYGGYRWGMPRKRALLAWEQAHYTIGAQA